MSDMLNDDKQSKRQLEQTGAVEIKQPWHGVRITRLGTISEIVLQGGGKLSAVGGDPGESRKPPGNDG